jgi:hypothetical protein
MTLRTTKQHRPVSLSGQMAGEDEAMSLRIVKLTILEDLVEVGVLGELQAEHLAYQARRAGFIVWRKQPSVTGNPISYILLGTGQEDDPSATVMPFLEQHGRIECKPAGTDAESLRDTGIFTRTPAQRAESRQRP